MNQDAAALRKGGGFRLPGRGARGPFLGWSNVLYLDLHHGRYLHTFVSIPQAVYILRFVILLYVKCALIKYCSKMSCILNGVRFKFMLFH